MAMPKCPVETGASSLRYRFVPAATHKQREYHKRD